MFSWLHPCWWSIFEMLIDSGGGGPGVGVQQFTWYGTIILIYEHDCFTQIKGYVYSNGWQVLFGLTWWVRSAMVVGGGDIRKNTFYRGSFYQICTILYLSGNLPFLLCFPHFWLVSGVCGCCGLRFNFVEYSDSKNAYGRRKIHFLALKCLYIDVQMNGLYTQDSW